MNDKWREQTAERESWRSMVVALQKDRDSLGAEVARLKAELAVERERLAEADASSAHERTKRLGDFAELEPHD